MKHLMIAALLAFPAMSPQFALAAHKNNTKPVVQKLPRFWYSVTSDGKAVGFFSEAFYSEGKKGGFVTVQDWSSSKDADEISHIETLTVDDEFLAPISFSLHHVGAKAASELKLNALLKKKKFSELNVKMIRIKPKKDHDEKNIVLPNSTIFYSSLPRYLARHEPGMYAVKAIMEDARGLDISLKLLTINRTAESKKFGADTCEKSFVEIQGPMAEVWVTKTGKLCELSIPEANSRISLATEEEIKQLRPVRK